jgi:hypothetical protein
MKRSKLIILSLTLATMSGCLVSSLHPFYKKKDKIFEESLVGNWVDGDSCIWTIHPKMVSTGFMTEKKHDSSYVITYYEDHTKAILQGTLFQLNGVDYVDFLPDPDEEHHKADMTSWHHVPVHTLARVQYNKDSILLYWYGDEWLNELLEQNRIRIKHERVESAEYDRQVLTADTDELQKFIRKYANNPKTADEIEAIFANGYNDGQEEMGIFLKLKPYDGPMPD